jgi:hypothetical protein
MLDVDPIQMPQGKLRGLRLRKANKSNNEGSIHVTTRLQCVVIKQGFYMVTKAAARSWLPKLVHIHVNSQQQPLPSRRSSTTLTLLENVTTVETMYSHKV